MFTEIEIICWVKYLQRFNLADQKLIEQQAAQCKQKLPDNSKDKQPLDEAQMKQRAHELDLRENTLIKYAMEVILFVGVAVKNMLTLGQEKACIWQFLTKTMPTDKDGSPFMYRF